MLSKVAQALATVCTDMAQCVAPPAPVAVRDDVVVISGGHLKAKAEVALPVRTIGAGKFWVIATHCPKASELLTGKAACWQPLCNLTVFPALKKGIQEARAAKTALAAEHEKAQKDEEDKEHFDFGVESVDEDVTPVKPKRPRLSKKKVGLGTAAEKPTVMVPMP